MPRRSRPRVSDSFFRTPSEARTVWCEDCQKTWREPCPECADHFADYHRGAFDGHRVTIIPRNDQDWELGVPRSIQTLFGRY